MQHQVNRGAESEAAAAVRQARMSDEDLAQLSVRELNQRLQVCGWVGGWVLFYGCRGRKYANCWVLFCGLDSEFSRVTIAKLYRR